MLANPATLSPDAVLRTDDDDSSATAMAELRVHGSWSRRLGMDVTAALRDCFASQPGVVVIDLHGLVDEDAASLPLWLAARRAAAVLRPPVRLALCLPAATTLEVRLRRIGVQRLPMYATMAQARTAESRPADVSLIAGLPPVRITVGSGDQVRAQGV